MTLIERARRGDTDALEALVVEHLPGLRAFLRLRSGQLIRDKESASDLVQSVLREVLDDIGDLEGTGAASFKQWLYRVALRKIADRRRYYRAGCRDAELETGPDAARPADDLTPSRRMMQREALDRVEEAFRRLPPDYREVLAHARLVGLSHAAIAEIMGREEAAVRQLLRRARARLAALLVPEER